MVGKALIILSKDALNMNNSAEKDSLAQKMRKVYMLGLEAFLFALTDAF